MGQTPVEFMEDVIFLEIFAMLIKFFFFLVSAEFAQIRGEEMANTNVCGKRSVSRGTMQIIVG